MVSEQISSTVVDNVDVVVQLTFLGGCTTEFRNTEELLKGVTLGTGEFTSCIIDDDVQFVVDSTTVKSVSGGART